MKKNIFSELIHVINCVENKFVISAPAFILDFYCLYYQSEQGYPPPHPISWKHNVQFDVILLYSGRLILFTCTCIAFQPCMS